MAPDDIAAMRFGERVLQAHLALRQFDQLHFGAGELAIRRDEIEAAESLLPVAEPRLGRRMARTFPLLPPPQKNWSPPSDSSPETATPPALAVKLFD